MRLDTERRHGRHGSGRCKQSRSSCLHFVVRAQVSCEWLCAWHGHFTWRTMRSTANESFINSLWARIIVNGGSGRRWAACGGVIANGSVALGRCSWAAASNERAALSLQRWQLPTDQRQLLIELRRHAARHGGSLQRLRERSAAWSQPQCPSRAMWLPLSANSGQRRAGEGAGGPASAAVPSCPSWSRSSAQLPQDRCTTAARSGIGALGTRGARVWPPWAAGQCADGSFRPRRAWIEALLAWALGFTSRARRRAR